MPIAINGSGSITGISAGGLPDACVTPADLSQPLTLGTAVASTSGTSIDFVAFPAWAKRITLLFDNVSLAAGGTIGVRIGSGSLATSGYTGGTTAFTSTPTVVTSALTTNIAGISTSAAGTTIIGSVMLNLVGSNAWVATGAVYRSTDLIPVITQGSITLGGALSLLSVVALSSSFDAGTINILYEG